MDISKLNSPIQFLTRAFQYEGTKLHPNILLMCKLLVLLITAHHFIYKISDPFIPFIPALDELNNYPNVFKFTLRTLFIISALALMFNIKVRTATLTAGSIVIISILASKPMFYNHTFICGCALFLAGLTNAKDSPYLLILQLSLVYFGASINKFLDTDWWSGAFMDTWLGTARENPVYLYFRKALPELVLAKLLSYIAMFTEFAIAILILFKRTRHLTLWFIIIFHTTLFTLTSFRFGHFIESLAIVLLAFLSIPKEQLIIHYNPSKKQIKSFFKFLDRDKKQLWSISESNTINWLTLNIKNKGVLHNHTALKEILLSTPNFFMLIFLIDIALYIFLYNHRTTLFISNTIFVWSMILYFLPVKWFRFNK